MLNFGDTFGERRDNWANGEYDHHHAFLMQFIRTADRKWYFLGRRPPGTPLTWIPATTARSWAGVDSFDRAHG